MSVIIDGKYYKDGKPEKKTVNPMFKQYNHAMQRRDHARDIIQAHKNGKPNPEFIQQYPEEAKHYFNEDEIRKYGNGS
jgi:hypothetical protein